MELTKGILAALATSVNWAVVSVLVRSLSGRLTPAGISAMRSIVGGGLVLAAAFALGYGGEVIRMPLWVVLSLWGSMLIAMGCGDSLFFASMDHLGVSRALTLSMANPLLTTVAGIMLFGEPVTLPRALGILLVIGGIMLIITGKGEGSSEHRGSKRRGIRLVLLAAGTWALSAVIMKPALQASSVVAASAVRLPIAGIFLALTPWTRGTWRAIQQSSRAERARVVVICLLTAMGSVLFTAGIKFAGVAIGNVLASTSPLFALPFDVWVLGERPSGQTVLGAAITVAGVGFMNL